MPQPEHATASLDKHGYKESFLPFGEPDARDPDPEVRKRFFGKYRGTVYNNVDPLNQGRLQLMVSDVLGVLPSNWATPCLPFAGPLMGQFVRPLIGAGVWVEFEQGDPQKPIWTGCFWDDPPQVPPPVATAASLDPAHAAVPIVTIETPTGGLSICDVPLAPFGSVCLRSGTAMVSLTNGVATIHAPFINLVGEQGITITGSTVAITGKAVNIAAGTVSVTGAVNLGT